MTGNHHNHRDSSRVLVLSDHSGQLDRRIVAEVNTLVESGREVTLVSVPTDIPQNCMDPRVRVLMPDPSKLARTSAVKRAAANLPEPIKRSIWWGWYFAAVNLPSFLRPEMDMQNLAFFERMAPPESFDAIHCHDLSTLNAGAILRKQHSPAAKLIYDSHELYPYQWSNRYFQKYWSKVEREVIGQADLVITVNQSVAKHMAQNYGLDRIEVLYNSFAVFDMPGAGSGPLTDDDFFAHFGAEPGGFKVVTHGSPVPDKNMANLVRAFGRIDPSIRLFMLADPMTRRRMDKLCRAQGISNVFIGGWVAQERVLDFIGHADLGVIPYKGERLLNHRYCSPNKLFEYIEAKAPVCANDLPELRRLIVGNNIGAVYAMDTAEQIAGAISDCVRRVADGEFSAHALKQARNKFQWSRQGERLLELYDELGI